MSTTNTQSLKANPKGESTKVKGQVATIFQYLSENTATASMVTEATGVPQKCICRYKRDLEKVGRLYELRKDTCKITGFKAWYLTTNPELFPQSNQFELF